MPGGTGMDIFGRRFPKRTFDKPFVSIYSAFREGGYDQVVHDVAIQNLPVGAHGFGPCLPRGK